MPCFEYFDEVTCIRCKTKTTDGYTVVDEKTIICDVCLPKGICFYCNSKMELIDANIGAYVCDCGATHIEQTDTWNDTWTKTKAKSKAKSK